MLAFNNKRTFSPINFMMYSGFFYGYELQSNFSGNSFARSGINFFPVSLHKVLETNSIKFIKLDFKDHYLSETTLMQTFSPCKLTESFST